MSNMYWMYDGVAFRQACKDLYRMVDAYVTEVRADGKVYIGVDVTADTKDKTSTSVLEEMEAQGASQRDMVEQVMHLLVAGMDTSAAALAWVMAMLAARLEAYARLRDEVLAVFGREEEAPSGGSLYPRDAQELHVLAVVPQRNTPAVPCGTDQRA